jgi:pimeloyl-ACP methyl ester carboxylesterase
MMQKIYFQDSEWNSVCGIFSERSEDSKSCIILCHWFTSSKDSHTNIALEKELNEMGIASLRFDFFWHWESGWDFENITLSKAVDDILNAIEYLKTRWITKIGLVWSSFGGLSSTLTALNSKDIEILILKSPVSDYMEVERLRRDKEDLDNRAVKWYVVHRDSKWKGQKLNYSFFEDARRNIAYDIADKIHIPVLTIHGDQDKTVPISQSIKLSKLIENCKLKRVEWASHRYSEKHQFDEMVDEIILFVKEHFQGSRQ